MRNEILFNLDSYVGTTQFYYYFFDGLFRKESELKRDILEKLNIPSSTYRTNRQSLFVKNNNHKVLLNHFRINSIDEKNKAEYNYLLSNLYLCLYYRRLEEITGLSDKLEEYIHQNNAFKPIFVLFRIFIKILGYKTYKETIEEIKEDSEYLKLFPLNYFHNEFQTLYKLMLLYLGDNSLAGNDSHSDANYPQLSWMYYQISSTICYSKGDLSSAIIHSLEAEKYYLKDFNFTRYFVTRNNIAAFYGYLDNYRASVATLKPIMNCMIYQWKDKNMTKLVITQYLYSSLMTDSIEDIFDLMDSIKVDAEIVTPFTLILIGIAYYLKGKNQDNIKEDINKLIKENPLASEFCNHLYKTNSIHKEFVSKYKNIEKIANKYKFVKE